MTTSPANDGVDVEAVAERPSLDAAGGVCLRQWLQPLGHGAERGIRMVRAPERQRREPVPAKRSEPRAPLPHQLGVVAER